MVGLVAGCRGCGGHLTVTMADLGLQPASNAFLDSKADIAREKRYPLRAKVCESCKLVQLDYDVAPEELFGHPRQACREPCGQRRHGKRWRARQRQGRQRGQG